MYVGFEVQLHNLPEGSVADVRWRVRRALNQEFDPDSVSDIIVADCEHAGGEYYIGRIARSGDRRGTVLIEAFSNCQMVGVWVDLGNGHAELWQNGDYVFEPS